MAETNQGAVLAVMFPAMHKPVWITAQTVEIRFAASTGKCLCTSSSQELRALGINNDKKQIVLQTKGPKDDQERERSKDVQEMMSLHEYTGCWLLMSPNPTYALVLVPPSATTTRGGNLPLHCSVLVLLCMRLLGRPPKIITLFLSIKMYDLGPSTKKSLPVYFSYLQEDARNITNGVNFSSKSKNQNFICVLLKLKQLSSSAYLPPHPSLGSPLLQLVGILLADLWLTLGLPSSNAPSISFTRRHTPPLIGISE